MTTTIYRARKIITMNPRRPLATHVAVRDGYVLGAGTLEEFESRARGLGGEAALFRGGDRDEERFHARSGAQKKVHLALKRAFDPEGLFNPGRLYGWL